MGKLNYEHVLPSGHRHLIPSQPQLCEMGSSSSKPKTPAKYKPSVAFPGDNDVSRTQAKAEFVETTKSPKKNLLRRRTKCYLDISIDSKRVGRIVVELRNDIVPRTAENFKKLCTGELGYGYKGCQFHRIIPNFIVQTGDVVHKGTKKEGTGGRSIYGRTFADEDLSKLKHSGKGVLSMAHDGNPHTNSSQFMIITDDEGADWLDGKHVVFGKIVQGLDVLAEIESCGEMFERDGKQRARITKEAVIEDCGTL